VESHNVLHFGGLQPCLQILGYGGGDWQFTSTSLLQIGVNYGSKITNSMWKSYTVPIVVKITFVNENISLLNTASFDWKSTGWTSFIQHLMVTSVDQNIRTSDAWPNGVVSLIVTEVSTPI
jgi:hypothetical protein